MLIKNDPNLSTYFNLLDIYCESLIFDDNVILEIFEKLFFIPTIYNSFAPVFQNKIDFLNYIENYLKDDNLNSSFSDYDLENQLGCDEVYAQLKNNWSVYIYILRGFKHKISKKEIQILKERFSVLPEHLNN